MLIYSQESRVNYTTQIGYQFYLGMSISNTDGRDIGDVIIDDYQAVKRCYAENH